MKLTKEQKEQVRRYEILQKLHDEIMRMKVEKESSKGNKGVFE